MLARLLIAEDDEIVAMPDSLDIEERGVQNECDDGDEDQRILGLRFAIALLCRCDELWVFGEKISAGMAKEIEKAEKRGMRIRRFNSKCEEVQVK